MKKTIAIILITLFLISSAFAWNWGSIKPKETEVTKDMVDAAEIVKLINDNPTALEYIKKSGLSSLKIKTDQRTVTMFFDGEKVYLSGGWARYTVRTTEADLKILWDKYQEGERITLKEIRQRFKIPFWLYWKTVWNIWFT